MSTVRVEETFALDAPPEVVWGYLIDPAKIVVCLPGAELLSVESERTYKGRVRVKVGAVTVSYDGTMEFATVDDEARRVEMVGKGREKGGAGTATMTMEGRVEPAGSEESAGSRVSITADVQLTGKIVRFGRGMIGAVSKEVFSQFATCLADLVNTQAEETSPPSSATAVPATPPETASVVPPPSPGHPPPASDRSEPQPIASAAPVSAFGLLFSTLRSSVRRFLGRLFGRA